jgi:hypothetical protein
MCSVQTCYPKFRQCLPCGAVAEQEPKPQDFLVKFPVSREMQCGERGLLESASTTNHFNKLD